MSDTVFATRSCATEFNGRPIRVRKGEPWAADDPFVEAKPDLFTSAPEGRRTGPPRVERATRAPGEVRQGGGFRPGKGQR
ncbi:MAG TPA: hypothetical protein VFR23_25185 [Jiangellaceae bacterium]|nr:hypothetical protein [Jiangellaceae bacterium]